MKRAFTRLAALGLFALGLLPLPSAAGKSAYCSKPVRAALFEFGVLYRSATADGLDARLLDTLEQRTGCTFARVLMPRARIWAELEAGTLDMATAAIPTPERKAYGYLLPYMKARNLVLVRRQSAPSEIDQAAFEASKLRLGVVRGFRHEAAYDAMVARLTQQGRVVLATDVADLVRMIDRGVVDAVLSQPIVFRQYLDEAKINQDIALHDWAPKDEFSLGAFILSRKSFTPQQAKRWDALIVELLRDGTLLKHVRAFLPADQARDLLYTGARTPD
jgi:polar amino acid transport system substrate-binding protein